MPVFRLRIWSKVIEGQTNQFGGFLSLKYELVNLVDNGMLIFIIDLDIQREAFLIIVLTEFFNNILLALLFVLGVLVDQIEH